MAYSPLLGRRRLQYLTDNADIARGQPVSDCTPISFHYTRNFRPGQTLIVEDELMMCQSEVAPQNMSGSVGSVCTLMTDLSAVPRSEFTKLTTSKGVEYLSLDFSLDFIVDSASLMFELKVGGVSFLFPRREMGC